MGQALRDAALLQRYRRLRECYERARAGRAPQRDRDYFSDAIKRVRKECRRACARSADARAGLIADD